MTPPRLIERGPKAGQPKLKLNLRRDVYDAEPLITLKAFVREEPKECLLCEKVRQPHEFGSVGYGTEKKMAPLCHYCTLRTSRRYRFRFPIESCIGWEERMMFHNACVVLDALEAEVANVRRG